MGYTEIVGYLWPYHFERTRSHLTLEAKQGRAWLVLGWETKIGGWPDTAPELPFANPWGESKAPPGARLPGSALSPTANS